MSKLSRSVLKGIVKECLVEILQEGLSPESSINLSESKGNHTSVKRSTRLNNRRSSALDRISYGSNSIESNLPKNRKFESNIKKVTENMTQDPVLSSILADTARTTLQEQSGAESKGPSGAYLPTAAAGDTAARVAASSDPMEIFSESAEKWAELAFSNKLPGR